jgi:mannose-6-phosphate isomerase-like protein (cupin superfamily)
MSPLSPDRTPHRSRSWISIAAHASGAQIERSRPDRSLRWIGQRRSGSLGGCRRRTLSTRSVLRAGDACVVPKGVWHRLIATETSQLIHATPGRVDGYTIGVVTVPEGPGPHLGEMHPDGDEFLHVVSGSMQLIVDDGDADAVGSETVVVLRAGDACVVPKGVWHRLIATETSQLIHATPGPNGPARPLR